MPSRSRDSRGDERRRANGSPPQLRVIWRTGPRTRAWDELWRRLLADVSDPEGLPTPDAQEPARPAGEEAG